MKRVNVDKFGLLLWRPRPASLLSEEKQKEIKKNLKRYYAQFESKDRMRQSKASKELIEKRATLMDKWTSYREERLRRYQESKLRRLALRNSKFCKQEKLELWIYHNFFSDIDTDELDADSDNVEEELVEFFIKEEITVLE